MLSKDEEKLLASLTNVFQVRKDDGKTWGVPMLLSDLLWLAEKLKEVNEELKKGSWNIPGCTCRDTGHYMYCPVICEHADTTKTKDLQDNPIRVCDDCNSVIEE